MATLYGQLPSSMLSIPELICTDMYPLRLPFCSFSVPLSGRCCNHRFPTHPRQFACSLSLLATNTSCRLPAYHSILFLLPFITSATLGESLDCYRGKRVVTINSCFWRSLCVGLAKSQRKVCFRDCGSTNSFKLSRRQSATFFCVGLFSLIHGGVATAESTGPLSKYVKRRQLYPLDSYIPPILLCKIQFQEVEGKLLAETPLYADARSLLRSGPLGSLRTDIRAVAQYALEAGKGEVASDAVEQCLRSLEDLDSLILRASRNDSSVTIDSMRGKLAMAVNAVDNLLQTVPDSILDKGKAMILDYSTDSETSLWSPNKLSDQKQEYTPNQTIPAIK